MVEHYWHNKGVDDWNDPCEDVLTLPRKQTPHHRHRRRPPPRRHQRKKTSQGPSERVSTASARGYTLTIQNLDEFLGLLKKQVQWVVVVGKIPVLKAIALELFIGKIDIEFDTDPEIPDYHYVVFNAALSDDCNDISKLRREWYRRTLNVLKENCDKVRLSLTVNP